MLLRIFLRKKGSKLHHICKDIFSYCAPLEHAFSYIKHCSINLLLRWSKEDT